jgi:hypothetical protein
MKEIAGLREAVANESDVTRKRELQRVLVDRKTHLAIVLERRRSHGR